MATPTRRSPRKSPKSQRAKERDAEVLRAAVRVFYERGYSDATVQDVADELGILKGSLYHYIKTKEDLLFWIFEDIHAEVGQILEEVRAAEGLSPLERLELYVGRNLEFNIDNLDRISIYYHDMDRLSADRLQQVVAARREHDRFVADLIKSAQDQGLSDPTVDPKLAANCVFATIIWTYRWYRPGSGASRKAVVQTCQSYALQGVGAAK
jgi:AcrR family transcriptional regulator